MDVVEFHDEIVSELCGWLFVSVVLQKSWRTTVKKCSSFFRCRFGGGFRTGNFHPSQNFLVRAWAVFRTFLMPAAANELSWWMAIFPSYYYNAILSRRTLRRYLNFQHRHAFNYSIIFITYLHNSKQTFRISMHSETRRLKCNAKQILSEKYCVGINRKRRRNVVAIKERAFTDGV